MFFFFFKSKSLVDLLFFSQDVCWMRELVALPSCIFLLFPIAALRLQLGEKRRGEGDFFIRSFVPKLFPIE